ncbi:MAG: pilus assembly protein PilM [Dehalococcoidia bacterium]|nr:pilus assembly protein PilM [Dehalococcoidia bacterium]
MSTTIYIDDSAIRVLVARGRKVRSWATMPLEPGLVKDGLILDEDAIARKVRELQRAEHTGDRKVIAAISGINCLYRSLTLPELPKDLLPEAVRREASRVLGVPLEQLYLSWQALPSLKGETLVYLAALPRNSADALISALRKAGLNPYLIDLKPLALARTITESRAIIIDLQPGSFDVVVMAEGIPHVARSLSLPQEASPEEKIPTITGELDRAITFYNSGHRDKPIDNAVPLLVSGELAEQEDVWSLLAGRARRPIQTLLPPMESPEGFPSNQYTTNLGLALKELAPEKGAAYSLVNLNALPEVYIPKPRPVSEVLFIPTIIAGIALVALGLFLTIPKFAHTTALRHELAVTNQRATSQITQTTDISNAIAPLQEQVSSIEATTDAFTTTFSNFAAGRDEVNGDLSQINNCLPAAVDLGSVAHNGDTLAIKGLADGEDDIFRYAKDLRDTNRFALVVITDMEQEDYLMRFTLTLTKQG